MSNPIHKCSVIVIYLIKPYREYDSRIVKTPCTYTLVSVYNGKVDYLNLVYFLNALTYSCLTDTKLLVYDVFKIGQRLWGSPGLVVKGED